ncbi:MAG: helix-turn-helix domain-containing protein [Oligoflexia bacterium]|nr:helix-turn-helix domain-containing protein [Oligoflexia bacterium]
MAKHPQSPYLLLGTAIRTRRKTLGLSQAQLGEFAGCGLTFVNQLESGKKTIRLNKLIDVLKVLGLELALEPGKDLLRVSDKLT